MAAFEVEPGVAGWQGLPAGWVSRGLPVFCLERWQSLHETSVEWNLAESDVDPPPPGMLEELGLGFKLSEVDLGYGWTRGSPVVRGLIAGWHGLPSGEHVVVACGGAEANLLTVLALTGPGDVVVVDVPNYLQVHGLLRARGARVIEAHRRPPRWRLPLERLVHLVESERPRAVFVTNPNNPTGARSLEAELRELAAAAARAGSVLVFDEAYRGLELDGGVTPSMVEVAASEGAEAVATGTLSKAFGLPGLRIGWAVATSRRLAERLWMAKDYTTISPPRPSEEAAVRILQPGVRERLLGGNRRVVQRNLGLLAEALEPLGLRLTPPEAGAFALVEAPGGDSAGAAAALLRGGILVNPGECFGAPGYVRVALGVRSEERAREAYRRLAAGLAGLLGAHA